MGREIDSSDEHREPRSSKKRGSFREGIFLKEARIDHRSPEDAITLESPSFPRRKGIPGDECS